MKQGIYTTLLFLITCIAVHAQDVTEPPLDTLARHTAGLRQEVEVLKRIKLSGYIQAQYQVVPAEISLPVWINVLCFAGHG